MNRFTDQGIIIAVRKYGENSLIVKILSAKNGICSGFVRFAAANYKKSSFQATIYHNLNWVEFEWSSRIANNLGFFKAELKKSFLGEIISNKIKLSALTSICGIIERNILEGEIADEIFNHLLDLLQNINLETTDFLAKYIKLEIELLKIFGYGIDLSVCVATGTKENLHFVSPKSAKAVCLSAGWQYSNKLLILPQFLLTNHQSAVSLSDLINGLKLSGFFIDKHLNLGFRIEAFNPRNQLMELVIGNNF